MANEEKSTPAQALASTSSTEAPLREGHSSPAQRQAQWYVLKAISGKESKVKEYIELDMKNRGLSHLVPQVLIPTKQVIAPASKRDPQKRVTKDLALLPGYVLVEAVLDAEITSLLRNTPAVLGFLGGTAKPTPVPQSQINRLLGLDATGVAPERSEQLTFLPGESVKIISGPFFSFIATVEEINTDKQKLKVNVKIFGRTTPLELAFDQVEKVS